MGANQSNLTAQSVGEDSVSAKLFSRHGFQILRVHPNSPVSEGNVQAYFDYIIAINGVEVSPDIPNIVSEMARNHVNKPLILNIYNSRQDEVRQVTIVPRTGWGGEGLLGCAIRFSPLDGVRDRVWHILKVHENSPAQKAGLIALEDYVLASPDILLRSEDEFYQLITQNTRRPVKLIVFNYKMEKMREIEIVPDFEWGGEGCMGCDVGSGMVHWIPKKSHDQKSIIDSFNDNVASAPTNASPIPSVSPIPQSQPVQSQSLLQAQLNSQPSSTSMQGSLADIPPSVSVNVPSSRPVIDNLSGGLSNPANANPTASISTYVPPPPMTQFHHQPHSAQVHQVHQQAQTHQQVSQSQFNVQNMDDDIPMPNFTVPSDIIHQK